MRAASTLPGFGLPIVVTGSVDGSVRAWDVYTGSELWNIPSGQAVAALDVAYVSSPPVPAVVFVLSDATVRVVKLMPDAAPDVRPLTPCVSTPALAQWNLLALRNSSFAGIGNVVVSASHQTRELAAYVDCASESAGDYLTSRVYSVEPVSWSSQSDPSLVGRLPLATRTPIALIVWPSPRSTCSRLAVARFAHGSSVVARAIWH